MSSPSLNREILRLGVPALGALAADPLVSLIDTGFIARLGHAPLAALGVDTAIFSVAFVAFNFLAYGTGTIIAHAVGQRNHTDIRGAITTSMTMAAVLGVTAVFVLLAGAPTWVKLMGTPSEAIEPALTYLRIRAWAAPAVLVVTTGHGVFRGMQDTATPLKITLVLNVINLVLDAVLILGIGLGIAGAALATVAAQWVGAGWFLALLWRQLELKGLTWIRTRAFLTVGRQLTIRTLSLLATFTFATRLAADLGTNTVAAHQVVGQLWFLSTLTLDALAIAAQAMVGRYIGEGDGDTANRVIRRLAWFGLAGGVVLGAGLWLLSPYLGSLFGTDRDVTALIVSVMPLIVLIQPLGGLLFVGDGAFMGALRFRFLSWSALFASVVALSGMLLARPSTLPGIWAGIVTLLAVRLLAQVLEVQRHRSVALV